MVENQLGKTPAIYGHFDNRKIIPKKISGTDSRDETFFSEENPDLKLSAENARLRDIVSQLAKIWVEIIRLNNTLTKNSTEEERQGVAERIDTLSTKRELLEQQHTECLAEIEHLKKYQRAIAELDSAGGQF